MGYFTTFIGLKANLVGFVAKQVTFTCSSWDFSSFEKGPVVASFLAALRAADLTFASRLLQNGPLVVVSNVITPFPGLTTPLTNLEGHL